MIRLSFGNIGSGKTACEVRELLHNRSRRNTYSNIITKGLKNNILFQSDMIVKKEIVDYKRKKSGEEVPVYDNKINLDFWKKVPKPINVVIDEAHNILNSRRSMTKANIIVTDWLALLRRVLGSVDSSSGELVLISQLPNRIDNIAREMATQIRFHRCHCIKTCQRCGTSWIESNDTPEPSWSCLGCNSYEIKKHSHKIEVFHFMNMKMYQAWDLFGVQSFHKHYYINDIEKVFTLYDTLQWDNLFENVYS